MNVRGRGVGGAAAGLTQAVGPSLAEYEPVPYVELRQQTVLYHLVHVVPGGAPQAAAEHGSVQARVLQAERRRPELLQKPARLTVARDGNAALRRLTL